MLRLRTVFFSIVACVGVLLANFHSVGGIITTGLTGASAIAATTIQPFSAVSAPEWDALFDRTSGWTGADGLYSLPLSGDERPGTAANTTTFFTFNDTFIGNVDANNKRNNTVLVNNTNALLNGGQPTPNQMGFYWKRDASGQPQSVITPNQSGLWFWPNDGIARFGNIYLFSLRMKRTTTPAPFNFDVDGISLLISPAQSSPSFQTYQQIDTPLYQPASGNLGSMIFGQAILPNTIKAGAPRPDGYLYIYGVRNDFLNKKLLVARVRPFFIAQFSKYQFWDGSQWTSAINNAAPISDRVSSEFSVTPLADGRFLLVFKQDDILGTTVAVRYGDSPIGPWGPEIPIWAPPETQISATIITYGAKAHPHLSQPGELLISYNVNTTDPTLPLQNNENFTNADIYRPRFIHLPLPS
jgi:hypothetical protein